jgi:hypothetical protein
MNHISILNPLILRKGISFKLNLNFTFLWVLGFILVFLLLVLYLIQINALIPETYKVQLYQKNISELSEKNKILEINLAKLNYLDKILSKSDELGFEQIDTVHYLQVVDNLVAKIR